MGAFAGHMDHLYDNPGLTFKKMKDIFARASNGEFEGTEKTDGQNLFVSYSVQTGEARGVRNKGDILAGGMNAEQLAQKFEVHINPNVRDVFVDAFDTFEKAVQSLDPELQIKIFGPDANVFYNSEIQDARTRNVIAYDEKILNIHQVGHVIIDKENRKIKTSGFKPHYRALDKALENMQNAIQDREYNVQKNAVRNLRALDDDIALNAAVQRLETELRKAGVSDNQTIADYLVARLAPYIDEQVVLPEENKKILLQRFFKIEGITFNHVVKGLDKDVKELVRPLLHNEKNIMKSMIFPIEDIVHDFSVSMLKGLESVFVLDNAKEVIRLRSELTKARTAIENSGNEEAIRILSQEMKKLKNIEDVTTAVEGFVFDYDGWTYKFTGNFAPMNQILGLFKYGRGNVPSLQKLDEDGNEAGELHLTADGRTIAIDACERLYITIPGAFKPPHKGHYEMVEHYSNQFPQGEVTVLVGKLPAKDRKGFKPETQANVTAAESQRIWELYISELPNVNIRISDKNSPVRSTYEFVGEEGPLFGGECIIPGSSTKNGDHLRWAAFAKDVAKYAKEGVTVLDPIKYACDPCDPAELHATYFREAMKSGNVEAMKEFLPEHMKERAHEVLHILGISPEQAPLQEGAKKKGGELPSFLCRLVEEVIDERDYQKESERIKDHVRRREELVGKGPQDPGEAYGVDRPKKRGKSGPPPFAREELEDDGDVLEEDDLEEISTVAAAEGGVHSTFKGLDVEKENEEEKERVGLTEEDEDLQLASDDAKLETVGDLLKALQMQSLKKKGGVIGKKAAKYLVGMVPGGGMALELFYAAEDAADLVKTIYNSDDKYKTNTSLDYLNVDDDVSKIVDDPIEVAFLKEFIATLTKINPEESLENLDVTRALQLFLADKFNKKTVSAADLQENFGAEEGLVKEIIDYLISK